ncbi:ATP-dependent DNA helicase [Algoriphagus chordae]|uniref:UvrD-like helicase family protein n=1 Tax=Algoriphagus chordae TaxID=237019 RepID=A0A2W7SCD8_9BACT|nr:DEAD/DEAH box helicase [Algoriphagus chordae]PZX48282.1 UvrD-like helicase family protein [Algoriphagus chordae]
MSEIQFSNHQLQAKEEIESFLQLEGPAVFILKGYAGTGKTTLLQYIAKELASKDQDFELLAPTGRAAAVLRAKTGLKTTTIHSSLYQFKDIDGEPEDSKDAPAEESYGQMRLIFSARIIDPDERKLFIVDEASMIGDANTEATSYAHFGSGHLLTDLMRMVGDNKLILSGDPCQLPPIGMETSPALDENWFRLQGRKIRSFEMTQILRQKAQNPILKTATALRREFYKSSLPKWVKLPAREAKEIHLHSYEQMKAQYLAHLTQHGHDDSIAVCISNSNVKDINELVRQKIYGNANAPLQNGDLLMVSQNNYRVPLTNGDFVEVTQLGEVRTHCGMYFQEVQVEAKLTGVQHQTLLCLEPLQNGKPNLSNDQQRALMIDFSRRMRAKEVKAKSTAFFEAMRTDPYLNSLRANFGYAVTCHKSQGGEWDHVFFFLNKAMYVQSPRSVLRWWYTGVTRAKEHLHLVKDWWIV